MDAHRLPAFRIHKDIHAVEGIRVHGTHDVPRVVGANGNEAQVERPAEGPDLRECRAVCLEC